MYLAVNGRSELGGGILRAADGLREARVHLVESVDLVVVEHECGGIGGDGDRELALLLLALALLLRHLLLAHERPDRQHTLHHTRLAATRLRTATAIATAACWTLGAGGGTRSSC